MADMIPLNIIHDFVNGKLHAGFTVLGSAGASFPSTARGPMIMHADRLFFALRFDAPVSAEQIGTPMAQLTISGRIVEPCTMTITGHLSVCQNDTVRGKFRANIYDADAHQIMTLQCLKVHWKGSNSSGSYIF